MKARKTKAQLERENEALAAQVEFYKLMADKLMAALTEAAKMPAFAPYIFAPVTVPAPFYMPSVAPFAEPWVITTCSTSDKVLS